MNGRYEPLHENLVQFFLNNNKIFFITEQKYIIQQYLGKKAL